MTTKKHNRQIIRAARAKRNVIRLTGGQRTRGKFVQSQCGARLGELKGAKTSRVSTPSVQLAYYSRCGSHTRTHPSLSLFPRPRTPPLHAVHVTRGRSKTFLFFQLKLNPRFSFFRSLDSIIWFSWSLQHCFIPAKQHLF